MTRTMTQEQAVRRMEAEKLVAAATECRSHDPEVWDDLAERYESLLVKGLPKIFGVTDSHMVDHAINGALHRAKDIICERTFPVYMQG